MATLTSSLDKNALVDAYQAHPSYDICHSYPIYRGLVFSVVAMNWEGSPNTLSDAFEYLDNDASSYQRALSSLGYDVETKTVSESDARHFHWSGIGLFSSGDQVIIATKIGNGVAHGYDFLNDTQVDISLVEAFELNYATQFSQLFRESSGGGAATREWMKRTTAPYVGRVKEIFLISFFINILGALNPFFIMSVYQFALPASSLSNLVWIVVGALIVVTGEYYFKRLRSERFERSGAELANYISHAVLSKLVWLPYSRTSTATESAQIARIRDIDNIRKTLTSESTQAWFDLPFVILFIVAILSLAGSTALIVIIGVIIMIIFATISKGLSALAATQSSIASSKLQSQWHETLAALDSIQGLPLERIVKLRFTTALEQSEIDGVRSRRLNSKIMTLGGTLSQLIGATCIIYAAVLVMDGTIDFGAMLAIVMLVWKCLTPFVGIYNSMNRLKQVGASSQQVDTLMQLPDERVDLNKSTPIYHIDADVVVSDLTARMPGTDFMLRQLSFNVKSGQWVAVAGPSGCGKTLLMNILLRLVDNFQGVVTIDSMSIKQFNAYTYRQLVKSKPQTLDYFEVSLRDNFAMYCGSHNDDYLQRYLEHMRIEQYFEHGIDTILTPSLLTQLPGDVVEVISAFITLGSDNRGLILLDEPLPGADPIYQQRFTNWLRKNFSEATFLFFTNERTLISACSNIVLLDREGGQKYVGSVDKVLENYDTLI